MTTAWEDKLCLLTETREDDDFEALSVQNLTFRHAEHLLTCYRHLLDGTIIELKELAVQGDLDISLTVLSVNPLVVGLVTGTSDWVVNERIDCAKEFLEDLEVLSHIDVAKESVLAFHNSMLQAVLAILVVDFFH